MIIYVTYYSQLVYNISDSNNFLLKYDIIFFGYDLIACGVCNRKRRGG